MPRSASGALLWRTTRVPLIGKTRRTVEDMPEIDNTFGAFLTSRRARLSRGSWERSDLDGDFG